VLVAGEAGVGKSALMEELQRDLPDARWSWGACDGLFTPRPLGPLFDLAGQLGGELEDLCRTGAAREDLFRALVRQVSKRGTLDVVVIEDVHWADKATVDMLRFLGRRLRGASALLIGTYRDDGLAADDPLRVALGDVAAQRSTRRVELASLSADAVRRLAVEAVTCVDSPVPIRQAAYPCWVASPSRIVARLSSSCRSPGGRSAAPLAGPPVGCWSHRHRPQSDTLAEVVSGCRGDGVSGDRG
jgi:predicted ATPase